MARESQIDRSPNSVTVQARSVEEAISKGLSLLGVPRNRVTVRILAEGNKGLFGMLGARPAKVRLTLKQ